MRVGYFIQIQGLQKTALRGVNTHYGGCSGIAAQIEMDRFCSRIGVNTYSIIQVRPVFYSRRLPFPLFLLLLACLFLVFYVFYLKTFLTVLKLFIKSFLPLLTPEFLYFQKQCQHWHL